ncbi:hypothetical protein LI90_3017 [Carbonactinospora thermoautotrophica]|uniref:Uncharacterized protein n=2 Tax=Carbonactinospora thermoautotrophica TaxID=1469144 RepID=A0A132MX90_9ACTN|nr:hypothetical protein [Carbonactinospora thermoautotrophica]KWX01982.1 hypothetical protein LI90_3017 [Carbonactinospora thermoautotrophica]
MTHPEDASAERRVTTSDLAGVEEPPRAEPAATRPGTEQPPPEPTEPYAEAPAVTSEKTAAAPAAQPAEPGPDAAEAPAAAQAPPPEAEQPLLPADDAEPFRTRWHDIQAGFIDDPRSAVQSADQLVAELMQTLAQTFDAHKQGLEGQWQRGEQVATEDLRNALRRYRSFFNRLLSA